MTASDLPENGNPAAGDSFASQAAGVSPGQVRHQLERICQSSSFRAANRLKEFLCYVVEQSLGGAGDHLKEYSIAVEALNKDESFDPRTDPIVRVEASKLRSRLTAYYQNEGARDPVRIEL